MIIKNLGDDNKKFRGFLEIIKKVLDGFKIMKFY